MSEMVERVAMAIDAVQLFVRFNDWASGKVDGLPIEICRYGNEGEDEIVVLKRFPDSRDQSEEVLREAVSDYRARAAIEAMREPTEAMIEAANERVRADSDNLQCPDWYSACIDAALKP